MSVSDEGSRMTTGPLQDQEVVDRGGVLFFRQANLVFAWAPGSDTIELREADDAGKCAYGKVLAHLDVDALGVEFNLVSFRDSCRAFLRVAAKGPSDDWQPRCSGCERQVASMEDLRYGHCIGCLAEVGVLEKAMAAQPMEDATAELDAETPRSPEPTMVEEFGDMRFTWHIHGRMIEVTSISADSADSEIAWLGPKLDGRDLEFGNAADLKACCMHFYREMLETFGQKEEPDASAELDAETPRVVANFETSLEAGSFDVELEIIQEGERPRYGLLHSPEELDDLRLNAADAARLSRLFNAADEAIRTGVGSDLGAHAMAELLSEEELRETHAALYASNMRGHSDNPTAVVSAEAKLHEAVRAARGKRQDPEPATPVESSEEAEPPSKPTPPEPEDEPVEGEIVLVARDNDAEQRPITATFDPSCKLVQFIEYGEEVFGTLEPVTEREWVEIVGRLGQAAPFMLRVLELVKAVELAAVESRDSRVADDLRGATARFAGAIDPEKVVEVAHAADKTPQITPEEAEGLFACYSGGRVDGELLNRVTPKLEAIAGKELVP